MRNNAEDLALPAWQAAIDPISKLLLILLFTLAAFAAGN
ncbi:energy-coupling factor transporter transmembrane protein EcfT, partial [Lactobacillus delbrueckii subsp. bulgaricus]|nr:energy-coupling factor transporter transmembrane protein EcfT [Lactobacillus delbrueckii subsp. bulgaricus]